MHNQSPPPMEKCPVSPPQERYQDEKTLLENHQKGCIQLGDPVTIETSSHEEASVADYSVCRDLSKFRALIPDLLVKISEYFTFNRSWYPDSLVSASLKDLIFISKHTRRIEDTDLGYWANFFRLYIELYDKNSHHGLKEIGYFKCPEEANSLYSEEMVSIQNSNAREETAFTSLELTSKVPHIHHQDFILQFTRKQMFSKLEYIFIYNASIQSMVELFNTYPNIRHFIYMNTDTIFADYNLDTDEKKLSSSLQSLRSLESITINAAFLSSILRCISATLITSNSLQSLTFENHVFKDETLEYFKEALVKSKSLKELSMKKCLMRSPGLEFLTKAIEMNTSLCAIHFSNCRIKGNGLPAIIEAISKTSIQKVDIRGELLNAEELAHLLSCNLLEVIHLEGCGIVDEVCHLIGNAIRNNKRIRTLCLAKNWISSKGVLQILNALNEECTLEFLDLSSNKLFAQAVKVSTSFATMMSRVKCLKHINLEHTNLTDDFILALSNLVKWKKLFTSTIEELNLGFNSLSMEGVFTLCHIKQSFPRLRQVDLRGNKLKLDDLVQAKQNIQKQFCEVII